MALDKVGLKANIKAFFEAMEDEEMTVDEQAERWANLIDTFVKTGTVSGFANGSATAVGAMAGGPGVPVPIVNLPIEDLPIT